jgi:hypothetical protein
MPEADPFKTVNHSHEVRANCRAMWMGVIVELAAVSSR